MRIIQTRRNLWEIEYDNGQRVVPGDIMKDNNGNTVLFQGIADGHVELSEYDDALCAESPHRVPIGEFLDKFMPDHERLGQTSPIGIVRDHPSHGEGEDSRGPSVVDRGRIQLEKRWAKETIGLAAVELNEAYAQFEITRDGCSIPSGELHRAARRLKEAMQRLGLTGDEIPF